MLKKRKKYAVIGASNRAYSMFLDAIRTQYTTTAELVAMLDVDAVRMRNYNTSRECAVPAYLPAEFDKMLAEAQPDVIIVATSDSSHHTYVIKALQHNIEVICEKPLTIDEDKCRAIYLAEQASSANVRVIFNLRYAPHLTKMREIVESGKIGRVVSVDLNWYLDTYHGSSYFNRWNRLREESGGLSITKATHHFDLVRWFIGQNATEVFAYGVRNFYGPGGVQNPLTKEQIGDGRTCLTCDIKHKCKYYMRWYRAEFRGNGDGQKIDDHIGANLQYTDYCPRMCIFDPEINIEDTYAAVVKFDGGAFLSYSLNVSMPYEGFRFGINGTEGRLECKEFIAPLRLPFPAENIEPVITYIPMFGGREQVDVISLDGSHGGSDPLLRDELFIGEDLLAPVKRQAALSDGIESVMIGIAIHQASTSGKRISLTDMRTRIFG